jgi:hypothetical protein
MRLAVIIVMASAIAMAFNYAHRAMPPPIMPSAI